MPRFVVYRTNLVTEDNFISTFTKLFNNDVYKSDNKKAWTYIRNVSASKFNDAKTNWIFSKIPHSGEGLVDNDIENILLLANFKTVHDIEKHQQPVDDMIDISLSDNIVLMEENQTQKNYSNIDKLFGVSLIKYSGQPDFLAGLPTKFTAILSHNRQYQLKELLASIDLVKRSVEQNNFHMFLEILAKQIIYREPMEGLVIPAPNYTGHNNNYYIIKQFVATGKGCTFAYLESPFNEPPIIVFSGSQFHPSGLDCMSSYISDMDFVLGQEAFESAQIKLDLILNKNMSEFIVVGHSLGGNLAQHLTAHRPDKVCELVTFSSPGISSDIDFEFTKKILKFKKCPIISIYQTRGDIVHYAGTHLGYNDLENINIRTFQFDPPQTAQLLWESPLYFFVRPHTYACLSNIRNLELNPVIILDKSEQKKILKTDIHNTVEMVRKNIGGRFISPILKFVRNIARSVMPSRCKNYA